MTYIKVKPRLSGAPHIPKGTTLSVSPARLHQNMVADVVPIAELHIKTAWLLYLIVDKVPPHAHFVCVFILTGNDRLI